MFMVLQIEINRFKKRFTLNCLTGTDIKILTFIDRIVYVFNRLTREFLNIKQLRDGVTLS